MKDSLTKLWNHLKADARQDNMTKAKIAVQTVQHALTGIEAVASVTPSLPKAEQETSLTKHYVLAQYRGNSRKLAGRLFVLRKKRDDRMKTKGR